MKPAPLNKSLDDIARGLAQRVKEDMVKPLEDQTIDIATAANIFRSLTQYWAVKHKVTPPDFGTVDQAGVRTQFWTHGFVHAEKGLDRALVVGKIIVGDNVYIGSGSVVTCGVRIADAVTLGVATSVVKSLDKPGLYAAQPLRWFDRDSKSRLAALAHVEGPTPQDSYYRRDP